MLEMENKMLTMLLASLALKPVLGGMPTLDNQNLFEMVELCVCKMRIHRWPWTRSFKATQLL